MYKVIFIDIDGTLKDSNGHISNNTIVEIKKIKNMGFKLFYVLEEIKRMQ